MMEEWPASTAGRIARMSLDKSGNWNIIVPVVKFKSLDWRIYKWQSNHVAQADTS
jgi:hypothetical protein